MAPTVEDEPFRPESSPASGGEVSTWGGSAVVIFSRMMLLGALSHMGGVMKCSTVCRGGSSPRMAAPLALLTSVSDLEVAPPRYEKHTIQGSADVASRSPSDGGCGCGCGCGYAFVNLSHGGNNGRMERYSSCSAERCFDVVERFCAVESDHRLHSPLSSRFADKPRPLGRSGTLATGLVVVEM